MLDDLKFGLRLLIKSPAFVFVAVFSLAVGMAVNTAVFSLLNALCSSHYRSLTLKDWSTCSTAASTPLWEQLLSSLSVVRSKRCILRFIGILAAIGGTDELGIKGKKKVACGV
jgi:hypothetical protein